MESHILRTDEKGKFSVTDLFSNNQVLVSFPHRVGITVNRLGENITLYCDLGLMGSDIDFKEICTIDISNKDYYSAIHFSNDFMNNTKSFESSHCIGKFVQGRANPHSNISANDLGRSWNDQVYIHLAKPTIKRIANIEFSIIQEDYIEFSNELCGELEKPARTLVASLQLCGQPAHYFFFVEWSGDEYWLYQKNFFFNNTSFLRK